MSHLGGAGERRLCARRRVPRLLIPLAGGHGSRAGLPFKVALAGLDQLDQFRNYSVGSAEENDNWIASSATC